MARRGRSKTQYRRQGAGQKKERKTVEELESNASNSTKNRHGDCSSGDGGGVDAQPINVACSTPKGKSFRIPELLSCPPAPMKRRPPTAISCSSHRASITFFTSPELELFFLSALCFSV